MDLLYPLAATLAPGGYDLAPRFADFARLVPKPGRNTLIQGKLAL
jgi:hypothetical protein